MDKAIDTLWKSERAPDVAQSLAPIFLYYATVQLFKMRYINRNQYKSRYIVLGGVAELYCAFTLF